MDNCVDRSLLLTALHFPYINLDKYPLVTLSYFHVSSCLELLFNKLYWVLFNTSVLLNVDHGFSLPMYGWVFTVFVAFDPLSQYPSFSHTFLITGFNKSFLVISLSEYHSNFCRFCQAVSGAMESLNRAFRHLIWEWWVQAHPTAYFLYFFGIPH